MGKYSDQLMSKSVISPDKEIVIVDEDYISKEPTTIIFNIKENFSYEFEILDSNGKECYRTKAKSLSDTRFVYDLKDKPLVSIKEGFTTDKIFSEKKTKKEIAKIKPKNSTKAHKYEIEYSNKATRKDEILNMNCSNSFTAIGIFNGREKEGATMVCRIRRTSEEKFLSSKYQYTMEIAPNVDTLFMITLGIYILRHKSNESNAFYVASACAATV